jgi:hypothetical protein
LLKKRQKFTEDVRAVRVRERKYRHVYYSLNPKWKKSSKNGKVLKASSSRGMVTDIDGKRRSLQKTRRPSGVQSSRNYMWTKKTKCGRPVAGAMAPRVIGGSN